MARVKGPLLSQTALGKFGECLIFSKTPNTQIVKFATPPRVTFSNPQIVIRAIYGIIIADWRIADVSIINLYKARAKGKRLLGVNVFYKEFWHWIFDSRYGDSRYGIGRYIKA